MGALRRGHRLAAMSTLGIVLIVIGGVLLVLLAGGFAGAARRRRIHGHHYARNLAAADRALEQARAADKGWYRAILEEAVRTGLRDARPGWGYDELTLVLVDDRPGTVEDRAHFVATGNGDEARVILARRESGWAVERVD